MKKLLIFLFLLIANPAWAAYFERTDCGDITGPEEADVCAQKTTVSGRTSGHLYIYRSAAWVDVDTLGGSGAPADATYITQTANGGLSAEQALGSLATGILKNTTTTGVLSIATEGTDYYKPGGTDVAVADGGTGRSTLTNHGVVVGAGTTGVSVTGTGSAGQVLTSNGASADPTFQTLAGSGTVTSVDGAASGIFSITGGPITGSGTLTLGQTGTSGGIPFFSSSSALTSSGVLAAGQLVLGGGGGSTPTTLGSLGTSTTVLHGNAAGAPSFSAVSLLTDTTGTLPVASGGTNLTTATDDNVMVGNGTTWQTKAVPDCDDSGGNHLNYDTATNTFACGTSSSGAASVAFSGITGATNSTAAMVVGTGASLAVSGSGTIAATTSADAIAHIADTTDAHAGTAITNTPAGNIAATTVQAAINELDTEKLSTSGTAAAATVLAANPADCAAGAYAKSIVASGDLTCDILIVSSTNDPTPDDDTGDNFIVGTKWINTSSGSIFVATDVTATAAVWPQVYPPIGETDTLATVTSRGNITPNCLEATPCQFGNGSVYLNIYCTDENDCVAEMSQPGTTLTRIRADQVWQLYDVEAAGVVLQVDPDAATQIGKYTFGTAYKPTKSIYFPAASLTVDGTQCAQPALATINSGAPRYTIICTDNDASSIYGEVSMPKSWDGGTVTFQHHYIQTAADTNVLNGDIAASCRLAGATINNTWGTEIAIDDAAVSGSNVLDITGSAAVTPNGTCTAGTDRILQFRYQVDAGGTTTAVATLHHIGFKMEYSVTSLSD